MTISIRYKQINLVKNKKIILISEKTNVKFVSQANYCQNMVQD